MRNEEFEEQEATRRPLPGWARKGLLIGAAFAVPALINGVLRLRQRSLGAILPGESGVYSWPLGSIAYEVKGGGEPLVLVHGIGAGESSYEWRRNFEVLARDYRVYALDLPGFGKSERRAQTYTADLYVSALHDFLRDVVGKPATVMASSLSGAFAAKLAHIRPELVTKLVLICPTGLEQLRKPKPGLSQLVYGLLSLPAWGTGLYNAITSRHYIETYLRENVYYDPVFITPAVLAHYYRSAHQTNGKYALRSFLSGLLSCDLRPFYSGLQQPLLIAWGRRPSVTPVENADAFLKENPNARLRVFENSRLLPHDEESEDFNAAVLTFLANPNTPARTEAASVLTT